MRVAFLLTQDRGGPVDVTVRLATALQASTEVRVFGPKPARDAHLIDHQEISVPRKGDLKASREARAAIKAWRPDVVHAQDRRSGLVCAGLSDIPVVHTYHGVPDDVSEQWFRAARPPRPSMYTMTVLAADALVARRVARTIVPAPAMDKFLRERLRVPAQRITHIDNCVTIGDAEPPTTPVRRLLFVGLLTERKGLPILLEALRGALPRDVTLTVAGDGPLRAKCEELARGLPVEFLGFRADVPELIGKHDALVLPSTMEQQPLVIAEAMAAGKPVVATDTGGVADMLDVPGTALRLAAPDNPASLAKQLRALFADPDPAVTGRLLAKNARERFSSEVCAQHHLELYRELS
ncbi:glycosyl transferase [Lentzea aerocolonigenes]|uniref:Glycosyl transferase n=1 Tax=Lentzea aerocolonigenes TaxID=68170 RepID=A0A0F0HDC0_LENAE|nr:glycosyltransferase family 4 protein [Lentzea aerocolonigenes]KJK52332.1 glycosyl transferase [Lentzea aerocolonigenes]